MATPLYIFVIVFLHKHRAFYDACHLSLYYIFDANFHASACFHFSHTFMHKFLLCIMRVIDTRQTAYSLAAAYGQCYSEVQQATTGKDLSYMSGTVDM